MPQHNVEPIDVAVIGAGVIGLTIAWRAAARGCTVTLIERDRAGRGTSHVAAGMLAPVSETIAAEEPLLELGLASARAYPRLIAELTEASGMESVGYTPSGTLMVARDDDEALALEREFELRHRYGLEVRRLRGQQARALEPALAPGLRLALDVPSDHAIDPRALTAALRAAVVRAGADLREGTTVTGLLTSGGQATGVSLADGTGLAARNVVIAAGVWAGELDGIPAHARVEVGPIKGQILRLHDPAGPGLLGRVIRMGSSYVVPRGDGRYVIGATVEERGFDTTVTAGAMFELLRDASELVPGISELVIDEFSAGLRPGTFDNLPVIGPGALDGLHWAVGHRRGGILLAPITAEIVCGALFGEPYDDRLAAAFAPDRLLTAGSSR